MQTAACALIY